jgi:uncharacterized protein with FMN-binding domain
MATHSINYRKRTYTMNRFIKFILHGIVFFTVLVGAVLYIHCSDTSTQAGLLAYARVKGVKIEDLKLADGIYNGTADGFRPGLIVEIEIKSGNLTRVDVVEHNEVNPRFWQRPVQLIPEAILKLQSTDVDAVSGASATSYGIMAAVEDALSKAGP